MYPEGMLDRDQRTAKISLHRHRCGDNLVPNRTSSIIKFKASSTNFNSIINSIVSRRKTSKFSYLTWKKGYLIPKFQRLKNVLLVIVYLMLTILPTTYSAPSTMNPRKPSIVLLIKGSLIQINVVKTYAESNKDNFKQYGHWEKEDITGKFPWMPNIGKKVDDSVDGDFLNSLTIEEALPVIYRNFQIIDSILNDTTVALKNNTLGPIFQHLEDYNKPILELLKQLMDDANIAPDSLEIPKMPEDVFRTGGFTKTSLFATLIFRECINTYQYAHQTLCHLYKELNPSGSCS